MVSHFPNFLSEYEIIQILEGNKLPYKYLAEETPDSVESMCPSNIKESTDSTNVEQIDLDILRILDKDAHTPISEIAIALNSTANVITYHIRKMKREGVIQGFRLLLDPQKLDKEWYIVLFKLTPITPSHVNEFICFLKQHKNTVFLTHGIGNWQLLVDFHVDKSAEIDTLIADIRNHFGEIIQNYAPLRISNVYKTEFFPQCLVSDKYSEVHQTMRESISRHV